MPSKKRHRAKRLAIFNHKGGVGKTTLTVNIAAALAEMGHNVLLVDSDPQCNLTSYLVESNVVDDMLDRSETDSGRTIWSGLKPVSDGLGEIKHIKPVESNVDKMFLIPGDILLSEFESELYQSWGEAFQRRVKGFRGTTALSTLVNETCSEYKIDFVFYDSGPNIGPLNRAILLDCDNYIIPAACDLFSIRAFKTLGRRLAAWIKDWQTVLTIAPDDVYLLPGKPILMGYIPQRFRVYGEQPAQDYRLYLPRIERHIASDIIKVMKDLDPHLSPGGVSQARLGLVQDFGRRAAAAQSGGVPLWRVGNTYENQRAWSVFHGIASKIIERSKE